MTAVPCCWKRRGCCHQKNITGIYTSGVVFQPRFYEGFSGMMKEDSLPIYNWI